MRRAPRAIGLSSAAGLAEPSACKAPRFERHIPQCYAPTDPTATGASSIANHGQIPAGATWIDLEEPTREEEKLVERAIGLNVPTQQELAEIEPSSRLFERDGAIYMTLSALLGVAEGQPTTTPIGFVLDRQPAGHSALRDTQADPRLSPIMSAASPSWRATRSTVHGPAARCDHRSAGRRTGGGSAARSKRSRA